MRGGEDGSSRVGGCGAIVKSVLDYHEAGTWILFAPLPCTQCGVQGVGYFHADVDVWLCQSVKCYDARRVHEAFLRENDFIAYTAKQIGTPIHTLATVQAHTQKMMDLGTRSQRWYAMYKAEVHESDRTRWCIT